MLRYLPSWSRFWASARIPLLVAAGLSAYAVVTSFMDHGGVARHYGVSNAAIVVIYLSAAVATGLVVAIGGKWATSRLRGAALGFAVGALVALPAIFVVVEIQQPQPSGFQEYC